MGGTLENFREWQYYLTTKSKLFIPTYFSCGILNIQSKQDYVFDDEDGQLAEKTYKLEDDLYCLTNGFRGFKKIIAHLSPSDFCLENGKVKILDYDECGWKKLIQEHKKELEKLLQKLIEK